MTRDDMNSTEIVVETKKLFMTNKKNVLFAMINSEKNKWSNIDLNDSLNKVVNDKHKQFKKTNVAMSSSNSIFIKSIYNAKLLSSFTTLKQMTYSEIKNRYAKVKIMKIEKKRNKNQLNLYSFLNEKKYALMKWFYESKLTKNKVDVYFQNPRFETDAINF